MKSALALTTEAGVGPPRRKRPYYLAAVVLLAILALAATCMGLLVGLKLGKTDCKCNDSPMTCSVTGPVVAAIEQIKQTHCRNCLTSNRGAVRHSAKECREMGNKPGGPCKKCKKAGKPDAFHWAADCKLFG